jgi:AcrR family transcriptional regulator
VQRDGPDVSMNAIAAEAGITKPILYRWFGDKDGLYEQLAERHTDSLLRCLEAAVRHRGDRRDRTRAVISAYLDFVESAPEIYLFLVTASDCAPGVSGRVVRVAARLGDLLSRGLAAEFGLPDPTPLTRAWATAMVGAVQSAVGSWLAARDQDRESLADQLTDLICRGWGAGPGPLAAGNGAGGPP